MRNWRLVFLLISISFLTLARPGEMDAKNQSWGDAENPPSSGCSIPYGYTAACGYHASTANGECLCRENDGDETMLCMKSTAGTGCGLFEIANDPCCKAGSGF